MQGSGYKNTCVEKVYEEGTFLWELGSYIMCVDGISEITIGLLCRVQLFRRMQKLLP